MPNDLDSNTLTSLRQNIDALALEVALRDLSSPERIQPLVPMLDQIRRLAESAQMTAVAEAASVRSATEPVLRDVVSQLQQLVEAQRAPTIPAVPLVLNQDPELVADFIMESREHLAALEAQLLALEQDPLNAEAINTIFRGFHTIKGLAGFLDFSAIQQFAHEVETLLDLARNSRVPVDSALIDIILQSADHMSQCLLAVESGAVATGNEPAAGAGLLVGRIREIISETTAAASASQAA